MDGCMCMCPRGRPTRGVGHLTKREGLGRFAFGKLRGTTVGAATGRATQGALPRLA